MHHETVVRVDEHGVLDAVAGDIGEGGVRRADGAGAEAELEVESAAEARLLGVAAVRECVHVGIERHGTGDECGDDARHTDLHRDDREFLDTVTVKVDGVHDLNAIGDEGGVRCRSEGRAATLVLPEMHEVGGFLRQQPGTRHPLRGDVRGAIAVVVVHAPEGEHVGFGVFPEGDRNHPLIRRQR